MGQAEALNTLLILADMYPADTMQYKEYFFKEWEYVQTIPYRSGSRGDWYEEGLENDPGKKDCFKAHMGKGTYHSLRALMNYI